MMRPYVLFAAITALPASAAFGDYTTVGGYVGFASSSPFAAGSFDYFHLEHFEDGLLNVPGVGVSSGSSALTSGSLRDSVDEDDGLIDGSGLNGISWYVGGQRSVTFTFDAVALGSLPTHAGLVWTDVGFTDTLFCIGDVTFEAFDQFGFSLGLVGPLTLGDGAANGGTAEDTLFAVVNTGGISRITLSMPGSNDFEVDHLQFGAIPTPASALPLVTLAAISRRRR
jgi:hypothetical protein